MPVYRVIRISIVLILVAVIILIMQFGLPATEQNIGIGAVAPSFQGMPVQNVAAQINIPTGKITVLNFWATWCIPCEQEMPELQSFAQRHPDILIIGINSGEPILTVQNWLNERAITFPIMIDPDGRIYQNYRVIGQPTTFVIDTDGIISHVFYGPVTDELLSQAIQADEDS